MQTADANSINKATQTHHNPHNEEHIPKNLHYDKLAICFAVGVIIWFIPMPEALNPKAWHLFAIFIATILGLIINPMPMGALTIVSVAVALATNTISIKVALDGFASDVAWLVVMAFFIAKAFVVTGFGNRIAYFFTGVFGKKSLGLGYSIAITNFLLSPVIPSATARAAGIVYPIVQSIARSYESFPNNASSKKIGSFLTLTAFQTTPITSALFMTAMAANPLLTELLATRGISIDWLLWAKTAIVPGIVSLLIIPIIIYKLYPPEIKETPNAAIIAKEHLQKMGKLSKHELILCFTLVLLVILWGLGGYIGMPAISAAIIGISILMITGVLNWKTLLKEQTAWETLIWFSILLMMAKELSALGFMNWFSGLATHHFAAIDWKIAFPIVSLFYFYSHYLFASATAHVSAMFIPIFIIAVSTGTPPLFAALILMYFSNLFGGLTHYSTTPAPLLFGVGYVDIKTWWIVGFIISIINILVWTVVGGLWWKVLGLW